MPRTCTICNHPKAREIDTGLVGQRASMWEIAARYGLAKSSVHRHLRNCLPALQEAMRNAVGVIESKSILEQMAELHQRTLAILSQAEGSGALDTALRAVREARGNLELLGRLDGTLTTASGGESGRVEITVNYVDRPIIAVGATERRTIAISSPARVVDPVEKGCLKKHD